KRAAGLPPCFPLQSAAHVRQFSPSPASQMPFPQVAPLPVQSAGHVPQVSPAPQIPFVHPVKVSVHDDVHAGVPPQPPQVAPPRLAPSQLSPLSMMPLPHTA